MCGRYANVASSADLLSEFDVEETVGDDLAPSWNIAPTDPVRGVIERARRGEDHDPSPVRQLRTLRWGLVPSWSRDRTRAASMINARVETVSERPAFRSAAGRRRCLLPSLGYFEWQRTDHGKIPYFLHDADGRLLAMAGLYELWPDPSLAEDDPGRWVWTCTVITRPATDLLGAIHDRTPVLVPADRRGAWLDCSDGDPETARLLLDGFPAPRLQPDVVSTAVNSVRNNGPELIAPVDPPSAPAQQDLGL
jgi:putative SOS response-associated peptidase YedK